MNQNVNTIDHSEFMHDPRLNSQNNLLTDEAFDLLDLNQGLKASTYETVKEQPDNVQSSKIRQSQIGCLYHKNRSLKPTHQTSKDSSLQKPPLLTKQQSKNLISAFILFIIFTIWCSMLIGIHFFTGFNHLKDNMLLCFFGVIILLLFVYSLWLSSNVAEYFYFLFMLDTLLVTQIVAGIGMISMLNFVTNKPELVLSLKIMYPIYTLLHTLIIRLMLVRVKIKTWQIIVLKVAVFTSAVVYFCIAAYMMFVNYRTSAGFKPELDEKIREFSLLFSFANFAHNAEVYSKIGDFDQTVQLKHSYTLNSTNSVRRQKIENQKHRLPKKHRLQWDRVIQRAELESQVI